MHDLMIDELVKTVKLRESEGDCPTTKAVSVELLEGLVLSLYSKVRVYKRALNIAATEHLVMASSSLKPAVRIDDIEKHWLERAIKSK